MFNPALYPGCTTKGAFTPASLPNLTAWYKADALVLSNADPVASWTDSSGAGNHIVGTLLQRPTYNTNVQNGLPAVTFDGVANELGDAFTSAQPCTFYLAVKPVTFAVNARYFDGSAVNNSTFRQRGAADTIGLFAGASLDTAAFGDFIGAWKIITVTANSVSSLIQVGSASAVTGDAGATNPDGFTLGNAPGGLAAINATFGEVVIYSAAHDAGTRALVQAYLSTKWNIAL